MTRLTCISNVDSQQTLHELNLCQNVSLLTFLQSEKHLNGYVNTTTLSTTDLRIFDIKMQI